MLMSGRDLARIGYCQEKTGANPHVVQTRKDFTDLYPIDSRMMSLKPINTPYASIKPREDSAHHQVGT